VRWLLLSVALLGCRGDPPPRDVTDDTLVAYVELLERAAVVAERPVDCAASRAALLEVLEGGAPVIRAAAGDDRAERLAEDAALHRRLLDAERRVEDRCDACPDLDVVYRQLFRP
jgi:hypothetical protein